MRKALFAVLFLLVSAPLAFAQSEYKRGEFGFGYSANLVDSQGAFSADPNADDRDTFHGFYVNAGYNFSRYVGGQAEFSHHRKSTDFTSTTGLASKLEGRINQGLFGVKLQDNATETRVRPFARALIGVANVSSDFNVGTVTGSDDDTGFAGAFGGGLAFRLGPHADLTTSADWNPIHLKDDTVPSTGKDWTHNYRLGVGVTFRFGNK
ncbi:MAG: porin family protein [Acidobacteria bacterium]|nr:porin family protein [Acidobacteriota bacterium]MCA1643257.1 porin family protein [Acidobacteriota bacterium]